MASVSRPATGSSPLYVGLMSGTSADGVDAALVNFGSPPGRVLATRFAPYSAHVRAEALALNSAGANELDRAGSLGRDLADAYAESVAALLATANVDRRDIRAIGCHGQTVRHVPDRGFTIQLGDGARLAERSGIAVVDNFRSRDVAAGGQGAPLVPAFHQAWFSDATMHRVVANLGGIANITNLAPGSPVIGFDTGPATVLLDLWVCAHSATQVDLGGTLATSGRVDHRLLAALLAEPFFALAPPKSTGRDLFNRAWLDRHIAGRTDIADVQATLAELTAQSLAAAIAATCGMPAELVLCGGGVHNRDLVARIGRALPKTKVVASDAFGLDPDYVEAVAFAWLAWCAHTGRPGNLPSVTGARGLRVLGALHPA
ncbi:MAG: anhydro-N-acetylmuramic acid kinase [Burkholderiales bacterium]